MKDLALPSLAPWELHFELTDDMIVSAEEQFVRLKMPGVTKMFAFLDIVGWVFGVVLLLLTAAVLAFAGHSLHAMVMAALSLGVFALGRHLRRRGGSVRQLVRQLAYRMPESPGLTGDAWFRVTEDAIRHGVGETGHKVDWGQVGSAVATRDFIFILGGESVLALVPISAFPSAEACQDFLDFVKARVSVPRNQHAAPA